MSAPVSGAVTFSTTGAVVIGVGINANDVDTILSARYGTIETNGMLSVGHADAGNQFVHTTKDGRAEKDGTRCIKHYDSTGTKVLEGKITGGWGTSMLAFNISLANVNYPVDLVIRT